MRGRAAAITWCVGRGAAAVAGGLVLGTGDRGGELAAVLQQLEGPHHQPVMAPIWRVSAGLWLAGRCEIGSGGALLDDGHVPQGPLQGGIDAGPRRGVHLVWGPERGGGCRRPSPGDR
ncbi:hypothetical protein KAM448_45060 [Aeromonas caviae]|nr:hypothetical protein KAM365_44870 [Aeromonas caviae]GKQ82208.1 hypothetical protein KAM448_45020 [Aeromonas caviae]GKQ82212.1 hypothetical protein KAM448_45060 [Aeromonas caviae]